MKISHKVVAFLVGFGALATMYVPSAFAAGSGGGGGGGGATPPADCTQDTWECSQWGVCNIKGIQTRTCTITSNCPGVETTAPLDSRFCVPECTQDTWECSEWGICNTRGRQVRTCRMTNDCPITETLSPPDVQACQSKCTEDLWECTAFSACAQDRQTRTCTLSFDCPEAVSPKPLVEQSCTSSAKVTAPVNTRVSKCSQDKYTCAEWSQCEEDGRERRACPKTLECTSVNTPAPETERVCAGLKCGHLPTLEERIKCRLNSTDQEIEQEFKILYFPEYCKVEETKEEKTECIRLYQSFAKCWNMPQGQERNKCGRDAVKLGNIEQEKNNCAALQGSVKAGGPYAECALALKEKVEKFLLFSMYEYEVRAEALLEAGRVSLDSVAELEVFIENKKQEMDKAQSVKEWKKIVQEVRKRWKQFESKI